MGSQISSVFQNQQMWMAGSESSPCCLLFDSHRLRLASHNWCLYEHLQDLLLPNHLCVNGLRLHLQITLYDGFL